MDLKELDYIVTVANEGSISRAAEKLFMAQSSLSQAVRLFEQDLGTPIFVRTARGVRPTSAGAGYLDVSVPRVPHVQLCIHCTLTEVSSAGFPHSDISGSLDMCSSPKLFAAYHVFHRLLVPRHPPCALTTLTVAGTIESLDSLFPH